MSRPRFSEFLSNRRRQLGLSVAQAARVLRLKDQVIVAFEEGDWDRIPRAGYAQGMLSSYARYLGLNPREVIDLFQEDLAAYSQAGHPRRADGPRSAAYGDDPIYELPNTTSSSPRAHGPGVDKDLYGSAGPAGSILTGTSVSGTYLSNSSSPLVNGRAAGYSDRYLQEQGSRGAQRGTLQDRPYTGRRPRASRASGVARQGSQRSSRAADDARRLSGGGIQTRRTSSYSDDLRYGQASPYEAASSAEGRSASHNIAQPQRPNVRRRPSAEQRRRAGTPPRQPKSGIAGVVEAWFQDPRRTGATVFALVALILILIIVFSVSSCVSAAESTEKDAQAQVPVSTVTNTSQAQEGDASSSKDTASDTTGAAASDTATDKADADADKPVTVKVSVPDGSVSWIEVFNGGQSLEATTVTGPWEQSYTVDGTLTVRASDPSAVEVTANGDPVKFGTMVSGIGTATVKGPSQADSAEKDASSGDASTDGSDGTDASAADAAGTGASSQTQTDAA